MNGDEQRPALLSGDDPVTAALVDARQEIGRLDDADTGLLDRMTVLGVLRDRIDGQVFGDLQ